MPSTSPGRGGRVVALTEKCSLSKSFRRRSAIVDFPPPLGATNIRTFPFSLLNVLHLLADLFQIFLTQDDVLGNFRVVAFGHDGIEFAINLLAQRVATSHNRQL